MAKILQNFFKTTVSIAWGTGTGNLYLAAKPTSNTAGWLVASPNSASLREIVAYSGTGTDGTGDYIVCTARGVGGTTAQVHAVAEPVRMNITAEYWAEIASNAVITDPLSQFAATTSAQLAGTMTDETGTGALVFGTSPTLVTPALGTPSALALANATGLPAAGVVGTALTLGGGVMTGKTTIAGTDEIGITYSPASGAQTVALNTTSNNTHIVSGHASGTAITFTIAGATNSQKFIVSILQGGTTVSTITAWFASVRWVGGTIPTLTATLNKRDTFGFIRTGANTYDGFIIGQNS